MTIDSIAQRSFQVNGDFNKVVTEHMKLTQHDCYISTTQRIHEKCFDIQVCNVLIRARRVQEFSDPIRVGPTDSNFL